MLISCGCLLLFKNISLSCKYLSDVVSTWAKFDGHSIMGVPLSPLFNVLWECIVVVYM